MQSCRLVGEPVLVVNGEVGADRGEDDLAEFRLVQDGVIGSPTGFDRGDQFVVRELLRVHGTGVRQER